MNTTLRRVAVLGTITLAACSAIQITTPFGSTIAPPALPTPTDLEFMQRVASTIPAELLAREELEALTDDMREAAEDRYWAARKLSAEHPELQDALARALIETDNAFESPYTSAKVCGECHPKQFDEWSVSPHAYAQLSPVFNAMHGKLVQQTNGTLGDFCIRCHTPVGMNLNEPAFMENAKRNIASREGVTCVVCHRVAHDYGKISGRLAFVEGDVFDPVFGPSGDSILMDAIREEGLQDSADAPAGQKVHGRADKLPELTESAVCGACHDVTLNNAFRLEEAFSEYKSSPAALRGESCQDCHMGLEPGKPSGYPEGPAAIVGGKPTQTRRITNHMMAGPDYSIVHPGLFPHLPQEFGNPDRQELRPFFAELTAGRYRMDPSGTEPEEIPLWLDFEHLGGWGEEAFEDEFADLIDDLSDRVDEADEADEAEQPELIAAIERDLAELPDFKSWGGRPSSFDDLVERLEEETFDTDREKREKARRILLERQYRLLAEYRKQQGKILRAGYVIEDIRVDGDGERFDLEVTVKNGTDGHNVPTGFIAERTIFLQVHVTDAEGQTVFASGDLDPNGDVRDAHSRYVHDGQPGSKEPLWRFPEDGYEQGGKVEKDPYLFSLQSKFITRNNRGGEREQILAVNHSPSPLPFLRPPTSSRILTGRPVGSRIHRLSIEPNGTRTPTYPVDTQGHEGPFRVVVRLVSGMVPVNLVDVISDVGFDYGMSARDVAIGVVNGFAARLPRASTRIGPKGLVPVRPETPLTRRRVRLSGRLVLWEYELTVGGAKAPAPQQLVPKVAGK